MFNRINYSISITLIFFSLVVFIGCSKDESTIEPPPIENSLGDLKITPDGIIVNSSQQVVVTLSVPAGVTLSDTSITLVKLNGTQEELAGYLYDNGDLNNGDEIIGDKIYSGILFNFETVPGVINLQAKANIIEGGVPVEKKSNAVTITIYSSLSGQEFDEIVGTEANAEIKFMEYLNGNVSNISSAIDQTVQYIKSLSAVETVESFGTTSISIKFKSGLYGGLFISVLNDNGEIETKGGVPLQDDRKKKPSIPLHKQTTGTYYLTPQVFEKTNESSDLDPTIIGNRNVLIYAPFESAFWPDMRPTVQNFLNASEFEFEITTYIDQEANISALSNLADYGLIVFDTHGSEGKEFATGEIVDTNASAYTVQYQAMLKSGKLAIWENMTISKTAALVSKANIYAVRFPFIESLSGTFPNTVIFNGSCESTMNSSLGDAFIGKGAKTYYGFSKVVNTVFCSAMCDTVVKRLAKDLKTTSESFIAGQSDPKAPNAVFEMKGATDVHYPDSLVNGDFEYGKITGWTKSGDGRVISQLSYVGPYQANYMGIISTGLGYTTATGKIFQSFKVENNQTTLRIRWNFLSEEFLEFINSQFQDYFKVIIRTEAGGDEELLGKTIDGIAADFGAQEFTGAEGEIPQPGNLVYVSPSIVFDQGDVYMTDWQTTEFDISSYKGKVITLILESGDVGDSIYDTAILLDEISVF